MRSPPWPATSPALARLLAEAGLDRRGVGGQLAGDDALVQIRAETERHMLMWWLSGGI